VDWKLEEYPDVDVAIVTTPDFVFVPAYLPPTAIDRPGLPTKDEQWVAYESVMAESGPKVITLLDANAKIGESHAGADVVGSVLPERRIPERADGQETATDREGKRLIALTRELEMAILNDRKTDGGGGFTRVRGDDESILDYGLVGLEIYTLVESFRVGDQFGCSDHCPLELEFWTPEREPEVVEEKATGKKMRKPKKPFTSLNGPYCEEIEKLVSMEKLEEAGIQTASQ